MEVFHLTEFVDEATPDIEWIGKLKDEENCFVITRDNMIKNRPHELEAWRESQLTIVFLQKSWIKLDFWEISWKLIKYWNDLKKEVSKLKNPSTLVLHNHGKIEFIEENIKHKKEKAI